MNTSPDYAFGFAQHEASTFSIIAFMRAWTGTTLLLALVMVSSSGIAFADPGSSGSSEGPAMPQSTATPTQTSPSVSVSPSPSATSRTPESTSSPGNPSPESQCVIQAHSAGTKPVGQLTYIWGETSNCADNSQVQLQVLIDGEWVLTDEGELRPDGTFAVPFTYNSNVVGVSRIRAVSPTPDPSYSNEVTLERIGEVTANFVRQKVSGFTTYTWGTVAGAANARVWTEVKANGAWSQSQVRRTDSAGRFRIPLTYGRNTPGKYEWRVRIQLPSGRIVSSKPFVHTRTTGVLVSHVTRKVIGQTTNAWGRLNSRAVPYRPAQYRTEVLVNGRWSRSQVRNPNANGGFVIPLTYGATTVGSYRYRVAAKLSNGATTYSKPFTLSRFDSWKATIRRVSRAELGPTYRSGCPVGPNRLRAIDMTYRNYSGQVRKGTLIIRRDLAPRVRDAFKDAFRKNFRVYQMVNPTAWGGNDIDMMAADNTSAFNCRRVVGNPYALSPHAYGIAIDINPAENPYRDRNGVWHPNARYAYWRPAGVAGMHYPGGAMVKALKSRGFEWYQGWDWHHFQLPR